MITPINLLIASLWLVSALIDYSEFCYFWQLKEYRWDRFRDFLSTRQGKSYWLHYSLFWRSLVAIGIFFWPINNVQTTKFVLITLYAMDSLRVLRQSVRHEPIHRPIPTKKSLLVIGLALSVETALIWLSRDWAAPFLLLMLRFFIVSGVVYALSFPTKLFKQWIIRRAAKKLQRFPKLLVIGITGSYGKSSVKFFLEHLLGGRYRVLATPRNINTDIGVAHYILGQDFTGVDVFLVEMGAYRLGEIAATCNLVQPRIGILTAINEQHLALFGTIQKTQQAKYELLRALPKTGLAVVNGDNRYCREYLAELDAAVQTFGFDEASKPNCLMTGADQQTNGLSCQLSIGDTRWDIQTRLNGEHQCGNLAASVLVARHLGLGQTDISTRSSTLQNPPGKLDLREYGQATLIDDTYNSNPEGFKAALLYLKKFPSERRRVVITRGILELGEKSTEVHEKIGEEIALVADELIIITTDFFDALKRGVGEKYRTVVQAITSPVALLTYVQQLKSQNCIVLLENRLPAIVATELLGEKVYE